MTAGQRKVIGITVNPESANEAGLIVAVCDDGAVFTYRDAEGMPPFWLELPPVPGTPRATEIR